MRYSTIIILLLLVNESFGQNIIFKPINAEKSKTDSVSNVMEKGSRIMFYDRENSNNEPLYVVDGKPMSTAEFQKISPESIESMTVLKDSAAAAFQMHRANNGVIIIKTKKFTKRELRKKKRNS